MVCGRQLGGGTMPAVARQKRNGLVNGYVVTSLSERHTAWVEIHVTKQSGDRVSHEPLKNGPLVVSTMRIPGPDILVCLGRDIFPVRGICTFAPQRRRFVLSDVFIA